MSRRRRAQRARAAEEEGWAEAARRLEVTHDPGGKGAARRIVLDAPPWTPVLAKVQVQTGYAPITLTRCTTPVFARRPFRFRASRAGKLSGLLSRIGLGGVALTDPSVRDRLDVRSNQPSRARALFRDAAVSGPVVEYALHLRLERPGWGYRRRAGATARFLQVEVQALVTEPERLVAMVELTGACLRALAGMGVIDATRAPEVP